MLEYLSEKGLQHRNINSENIYINKRTHKIMFIDFSTCCDKKMVFEKSEDVDTHIMFTAPELFNEMSDYKVDIWSVGIIT